MKVLVVAGTRPEVIKLAPVLWELERQSVEYVFATTGQHYDYLLFKKFVEDLGLREPDYNVDVGSATPAVQTGQAMIGIEKLLKTEGPDVVVVEGDTNSVLAAALAAVKLKIPVAHVEAGLRSRDRTMPEEINRILADHCSEILFAPTEESALNLVNEGIPPGRIHIVGNTIVDATLASVQRSTESSTLHKSFPEKYVLLTLHRAENTDNPQRLKSIFSALAEIDRDIVFPIHPRTSKIIEGTELEKQLEADHIHVIPPMGYLDFLGLLKNAHAVLTDSGGIQEEAITLNVPCLTMRYNTERPETVRAGGNIVIGTEREKILENLARLSDPVIYEQMKKAPNPYGDGKAGLRIVDILMEKHENGELAVESSDTRGMQYYHKTIPVDTALTGKTVRDSGLEIIRVIKDNKTQYP
ncbi:MAG TPA: UDP-N-acetylglucosamine 2-epimerase (non-hydrolyzing), partial [Euryarchaeota archaeon]|nr:UDP-N-acetylglucosamine 2-epimerase (non-hydrolyzing) [Euryarchaeota archaeon]